MPEDSERYERFREKELILRDQLAIDRTKLSADRTFLSYARTALTMFIAGVTALHFVAGEGFWLQTLSWLSIFGALVVFAYGLLGYRKMLRDIRRGREQLTREKKMLFSVHLPTFRGLHFPSFMNEILNPDSKSESVDGPV